MITVGLLVALVLGLGVRVGEKHIGSQYWRFMFGFPLVIGLLQVLCFSLIFKYDTPKFLLKV